MCVLFSVSASGSINWGYSAGGNITSPASIDCNGTIYFGSNDGIVHALNADGTEKWEYSIGHAVTWTGPAIGNNNTIYLGASDGNLYAIGPPVIVANVNLGNYSGDFSLMRVRVNLMQSNGTVVASQTVQAASTISVTFSGFQYGNYTVQAFAPEWLSQSQPVTFNSPTTTVNMTLLNGDVNGDNFVEDQDYSIMGVYWYQGGT
jgi:outer membrane protein assembly factor BamB